MITQVIYFPPDSELVLLSQSLTGVECQTMSRMKESRNYQAQTASRRKPTDSPLSQYPTFSRFRAERIKSDFLFIRRTPTYRRLQARVRLLWFRTTFALWNFPRLGRCVGRKPTIDQSKIVGIIDYVVLSPPNWCLSPKSKKRGRQNGQGKQLTRQEHRSLGRPSGQKTGSVSPSGSLVDHPG